MLGFEGLEMTCNIIKCIFKLEVWLNISCDILTSIWQLKIKGGSSILQRIHSWVVIWFGLNWPSCRSELKLINLSSRQFTSGREFGSLHEFGVVWCMDAETWDFGSDTPVNFGRRKSKLANFRQNSIFLQKSLDFKVKRHVKTKVNYIWKMHTPVNFAKSASMHFIKNG